MNQYCCDKTCGINQIDAAVNQKLALFLGSATQQHGYFGFL